MMLAMATLILLASCGGGDGDGAGDDADDTPATSYAYTVKVMAGTTPIVGAKIELKNDANSVKKLLTTDAKGEVAYTSDTEISGEWVARITSIPDKYDIEKSEYDGKTYTLENGTVTITCAQVEVPQFKVTVVDQNGDVVVGARVQVCAGENCRIAYTDENGVASFAYAAGEHHANIAKAPDGYTDSTNKAEYSFDSELKCTIEITKN